MNSEIGPGGVSTAPRDYLFDNMRAILIILVVMGHLLNSMAHEYDSVKIIYFYLFSFHMPAMTFISGYFSKNLEKCRSKAFETLLVPYLILNAIDYIFRMFVMHDQYFGFRFFNPLWGLWYLLALFMWKFFLKDLVKIRFVLPFSFIFGILIGFSKEFSQYMSLSRVFCFLPFFLLGYYFNKELIDKIRRIPKIISAAAFLAAAIFIAYVVKNDVFSAGVLFMRKPYPEDSDVLHMFYRILAYAVAVILTLAMINLVSASKSFLSGLGTKTMTIYVLHIFTIPLLEKIKIFSKQPYLYLVYSVIVTGAIVFIYSRPFVYNAYNKIIDGLEYIIVRKKSN